MKKTCKVLHITTVDITIKSMLVDKMKELENCGYKVDFMSSDTGLAKAIKLAGFKHIPVHISRSIRPIQDMISLIKVYKVLKNSDYDIIHTHTAKAGFIGRIAAYMARKKIVAHTSHGLPFYEGQSFPLYSTYKWLEKVASWFSGAYFSQNKEDLEKIKKFVPKRVLTGYEGNGVHLKRLDLIPKLNSTQITNLKNSLGLCEDTFIYLMAARLESVKNHKLLIHAVSKMDQQFDFKVLIAGDGILKDEILNLTDELKVSHKFIFLGYKENIHDYIQLADAVLLTSEKEGIPRILMESMAFSKPVLATNVLGTRELVIDHVTGELVDLLDALSLGKKMSQWMDEQYQYKLIEYGINARTRIEQEFTETIVAQRIHQNYQTLLNTE
ncbi:glycosyltransferase family 4 protein [Chengkuizengella sediminis]|uniref:glycosyltransferase family 4 protein n=1 Tax=Chengkuizengella sediminis TaxID=1885917 RepID=UPI001F0FCA6E|nr:glycosyltransferase family 4 protein [Chengkuizengella sediminis]NDI34870.1 glycosyltransferase family 4 protein [Chengkuizengella sediminis]